MLIGAAAGFAATAVTGNPYLGVAAAALAGLAANLLFGYVVIERRANQLAAGLTLMFFGFGASALIGRPIHRRHHHRPAPPRPARHRHVRRSGLARRADGAACSGGCCSAPAGDLRCARLARTPPWRSPPGGGRTCCNIRRWPMGGALGGIGGAHLSLALTLTWDEGMTAGRGFIAIALVIFAKWNPLWAVVGALVFGGAEALQLQLQARGIDVSPFLMNDDPLPADLACPGVLGLEPPVRRARGARPQFLRRGIGHPIRSRRPS